MEIETASNYLHEIHDHAASSLIHLFIHWTGKHAGRQSCPSRRQQKGVKRLRGINSTLMCVNAERKILTIQRLQTRCRVKANVNSSCFTVRGWSYPQRRKENKNEKKTGNKHNRMGWGWGIRCDQFISYNLFRAHVKKTSNLLYIVTISKLYWTCGLSVMTLTRPTDHDGFVISMLEFTSL